MYLSAILSNHRRSIYFVVLTLALLSNLTMFFDAKLAKVSFYWAFYFSLAGVFFDFQRLQKKYWLLIAPIFLLGLSDVIWFSWFYIGNPDFDEFNGYLNAGKRLLLVSIIGYYVLSVMHGYREKNEILIRSGLVLTFLTASICGIYQHIFFDGRVDFFVLLATGAAYSYAALSAALIFVLLTGNPGRKIMFGCLVIFAVSYYIIFQTETRNVIASYPVIIIFVGILKMRHIGWKPLFFALACISAVTLMSYEHVIKPKFNATVQELSLYEKSNGNEPGSLTSRLAMWKIGINEIVDHPLGNSIEGRWKYAVDYVEKNNSDRSGLPFIKDVHLHNEIIDVGSLMGVPGIIVLVVFYLSLLSFAYYNHNSPMLVVILSFIVFGLTDVLFSSRELTIMLTLLVISIVVWSESYQKRMSHSG